MCIASACSPAQVVPALAREQVLVAQDIAWQPVLLQVPAGVALTVVVENRDAGVPHGFEIQRPAGPTVFSGEIVRGPARTSYAVPALDPGRYTFSCPVHPGMSGRLLAG